MRLPEHYQADLWAYFDGRPQELALYQALFACMDKAFPQMSLKVQKSQISFYGRHLFAAASLPVRRRKGWPPRCLLLTFGLGERLSSPRIAVAVEPYPGRWTHHLVLSQPQQLDDEVLAWLDQAWAFAQNKR